MSSKSVRVWAPRLSSRARAAAQSRRPTVARLRSSHGAGVVAGHLARRRRRPPSASDAGRAEHAGVARSSCAAARPRLGDGARVGRRRRRCGRPPMLAAAEQRPHRAGGLRPVDAPVDRLDHARAEHHAVEQRVRRQAVGAHHAVAARLAGHPQAGERRRAVEVGEDAAAAVVRGRRDRQPVRRRGRARPWRARRRSSGTARRSRSRPVASSHRCSTSCSSMRAVIGPAHLVAREQLVDEPLARRVAQQGAVPAQRLGEQRPGHRPGGGARWGGTARTRCRPRRRRPGCAMATPSPVASVRVGRDREELAVAAGGHEHVGGPHLGAAARRVRGDHTAAAAALDDQVEGEGALVAPRTPRPARRRPASARSRRRSPLRRRARCAAAEWPPSRASSSSPSRVAVEHRRRGRSARGPATDPRRRARARRRRRTARRRPRACRRGGGRWSRGRSPSTAATPPWAQRVVACWSSALVSTPTPHAVDLGGPHRRRQAGHARAEHEQVEVVGHGAGLAHGRSVRRIAGQPATAPTLSMSRARPKRAATSRRSSPASGSTACEGARVDHLGVVELGERLGVDQLGHQRLAPRPGRARRHRSPSRAGLERRVQHRGGRPLLGREVDVAARHGQAVGLAHRRAGDHRRRGSERSRTMRRTTATCCQSFSPKYAWHGPDDGEQLRDDGRHAGEVGRPGRALEGLADLGDRDRREHAPRGTSPRPTARTGGRRPHARRRPCRASRSRG